MCPYTALNFITLQEIWTCKAPNLSHLKLFGCCAYAHTRQDKLQPRAKKCIFLEYLEGVKECKLWCIEKGPKKVIINRDATFNKLEMPLNKGDY